VLWNGGHFLILPTFFKRVFATFQVYGYRGKDCRSNLYQLPTGEMVYFVAATVVLYNMDEQSQRHYLGHTDDVKRYATICSRPHIVC
jgi:HELP motif